MLIDKIRGGLGEDLKWVAASPVSLMQQCEASDRPIAGFPKGVVGLSDTFLLLSSIVIFYFFCSVVKVPSSY